MVINSVDKDSYRYFDHMDNHIHYRQTSINVYWFALRIKKPLNVLVFFLKVIDGLLANL